ncbi:BRD4-interacting chromatin-remodeling complex-associated protein-like [Denticeps clupeoides]|uniref:BRD4-interacting chromatin-remodeling complex-associated protein-like n=1 Tax=Denticeps clupeoides TaxID=299321 RepID=UPI0010A4ACB6|nr:BRD4-interacting chromatin-remodeling complex-associated protein-like [Denticeps clupeoides]
MDDEDDHRLLEIIGDVQALNEYLHGPSSKSIEEDDVTNAAYGNSGTFFTANSGSSNVDLKEATNHLEELAEAGGPGLQLSSSLQFIEEELSGDVSPDGVELGGEDQPFDILQKSLLEADITEQTLAQEALLDSQPSLATVSTSFPQQLVSGGFGGATGTGLVAPLPLAGAQPQTFLQQVPQLPLANGPTGHIQVLGSFNGNSPSVMTINSLERPQILLRPTGNAVTSAAPTQGTMFAPSAAGQISMPFKGCRTPIPVQNIIIQRGPTPQTLVRPIQPKPLQSGGQAVYNISNLGLQTNAAVPPNTASGTYTPNGSPQTVQQVKVVSQTGGIVVHSSVGQQGQQQQAPAALPAGQFLLPSSVALTPGTSVQAVNGQVLSDSSSTTTYSILTGQNAAVQLIGGQNFQTSGGQIIVNQGMVAGAVGQVSPNVATQVGQTSGVPSKVWTGVAASASCGPAAAQAAPTQARLTLVNAKPQAQQQAAFGTTQRLLLPVAQNAASSAQVGIQQLQFEMQTVPLNQDSTSAVQDGLRKPQLVNLLGTKGMSLALAPHTSAQISERPAPQPLTREGMFLQHLRQDHASVLSGDRMAFTSLDDVVNRLLPYHVFQGAPPCEDDFGKVDDEFETVATQVLNRTQSMVNKYRRLLMVEAERSSPSSEIVMIDRTFNQEERTNLTQDKRMVMVDPDGFLEDFCCTPKFTVRNTTQEEEEDGYAASRVGQAGTSRAPPTDSAYRTECPLGYEDPGGGTGVKSLLDTNKSQRFHNNNNNVIPSHHQPSLSNCPSPAQLQTPALAPHQTLADTDSVLEAAVNSILEC